jgi:nucleoid DNA-binding protein
LKPTFAALVAQVAAAAGTTQPKARAVLQSFFAELSDAVWATGRVVVPGLGAFRVRARRARKVLNPDTSLPMVLPAERVVACRVAKQWRRRRG